MGCVQLLKIMMFAFNGIIFLAGAVFLGVGIWVKVDGDLIFSLIGKLPSVPQGLSQVLNVGYLLIAIGGMLFLIGFLGCWGAIRENKFMLLLFFIIVLLVFIAEVVGAVVVLAYRPLADDLFIEVGTAAVESIKSQYGDNADLTGLWNTAMNTLNCCGFYNASDFEGSPYFTSHNSSYPSQCCPDTVQPCYKTEANSTMIPGCFRKIKGLIVKNTDVTVGVALGIAILETKIHLNLLEAEDVHEFVPEAVVEVGVEAMVKWTDRTMMKIRVMRILQLSMRYKSASWMKWHCVAEKPTKYHVQAHVDAVKAQIVMAAEQKKRTVITDFNSDFVSLIHSCEQDNDSMDADRGNAADAQQQTLFRVAFWGFELCLNDDDAHGLVLVFNFRGGTLAMLNCSTAFRLALRALLQYREA
ncbi:tetraspanin-1-like [Pholidichthys leucotaenia]